MKPFAFVLLIALFLQSCGNNGKTKNETTHAVGKRKAIRAEESFMTSRRLPSSGKVSYQWKESDSLIAHASTKELIALAKNHSDKIRRLIAFRALLTKAPHEAVNLAISEIEDTTVVMTSDCYCGQQDRVSNVRISMIQYQRKRYKVCLADSIRIDSALLFSNHTPKFYYMYDLYHKLPAKPEYEERLWQLYEHDHHALITLARFHKENTKQEIIRLLMQTNKKNLWRYRDTIRTALYSVIVWPTTSYKKQVRHVCKDILNNKDADVCVSQVFGALMAYNDRWSYNVIDKTMSKVKHNENKYYEYCWGLHEAYDNHPLPLFKPLYKKYAIEE